LKNGRFFDYDLTFPVLSIYDEARNEVQLESLIGGSDTIQIVVPIKVK